MFILDSVPKSHPISHDAVRYITSELQRRLVGQVWKLSLSYEDSRLVLRGLSETYHAKQLAQAVTSEFAGKTTVSNLIEVL